MTISELNLKNIELRKENGIKESDEDFEDLFSDGIAIPYNLDINGSAYKTIIVIKFEGQHEICFLALDSYENSKWYFCDLTPEDLDELEVIIYEN